MAGRNASAISARHGPALPGEPEYAESGFEATAGSGCASGPGKPGNGRSQYGLVLAAASPAGLEPLYDGGLFSGQSGNCPGHQYLGVRQPPGPSRYGRTGSPAVSAGCFPPDPAGSSRCYHVPGLCRALGDECAAPSLSWICPETGADGSAVVHPDYVRSPSGTSAHFRQPSQ